VNRFTVLDVVQRTPEWHQARCGRITGTCADPMLSLPPKGKKGESVGRRDLRVRLAAERLTGVPQEEGFLSADMKRGIEKEPACVAAYEALTGSIVRRAGFLLHAELPAGCSLDGFVGAFDGLVEMKCPKTATHIETLQERQIPTDYLRQITHNLWIAEASWCDYVSFDDRLPAALQLVVIRVTREDVDLKAYELATRLFLSEVDRTVEQLQALIAQREAA
jgi:hypothetical protein